MDSDTSLDSGVLSSDKSVLSFIVDLNKKYELEVSNAAGLMNTPHTIFSKIFTLCITGIVEFPATYVLSKMPCSGILSTVLCVVG